MKTIFVACQHGDEKTPLKVLEECFSGKAEFLVANPQAFAKNTRFIDTDLNRSFPGNDDGGLEEIRAFELKTQLAGFDRVLDLHTTSSNSEIFIITTSLSDKHMELISQINVSKVVYMENNIATGHSLIDHVSLGVSLEAGPEGDKNVYEQFKQVISDLLEGKSASEKEFYTVFDVLKQDNDEEVLLPDIRSFELVKKGDLITETNGIRRFAKEDFYPVMPGEKSYKGVLCLMARKADYGKDK